MSASVRVHFPKAIDKLSADVFQKVPSLASTQADSGPSFLFCGLVRVRPVFGGYCFYGEAAHGRYELPEEALTHADFCTLFGELPSFPSRQRGVYRHPNDETVTATLDRDGSSYAFFGKHASLKELYELFDLVRAGTITPAESWDAPQVAAPPAPSQADLQGARTSVVVLTSRLEAAEAKIRALQAKQADVPTLVADHLRKEVAALGDLAFELVWDGANAVQAVLGSERVQRFFRRVRP